MIQLQLFYWLNRTKLLWMGTTAIVILLATIGGAKLWPGGTVTEVNAQQSQRTEEDTITQPLSSEPIKQEEVSNQPIQAIEAPKPLEPVEAPVSSDEAKAFIYMKESSNNLAAVNPSSGACGIGQSLPCSKLANECPNWATDYECSDRWFTNYMLARYGSWQAAKDYWSCIGQCTNEYGTINKTATWW